MWCSYKQLSVVAGVGGSFNAGTNSPPALLNVAEAFCGDINAIRTPAMAAAVNAALLQA